MQHLIWVCIVCQCPSRMRHLIKVYTVYLNYRKLRVKWNNLKSLFRTIFQADGDSRPTSTLSALIVKGDWIHLVDFLPFCTREITFVTSCLHSCTSNPFWKGVYSKMQEFAPLFSLKYNSNKYYKMLSAAFVIGPTLSLLVATFVVCW